MNINDIKSLAKIMTDNSLTLIEFEEGNVKIKMEKTATVVASPVVSAPVATAVTETAPIVTADVPKVEGTVVVCPTVGVYYSSASPDSSPYVSVGSSVKKGDVLCIIEAMKIMNEITAECDGEIAEVYVSNSTVVEYGQPLFRIV